jgi:putative PEP-CTERM system TPR-repeat lipoprotein
VARAREIQKQRPTEAIGYLIEGDISMSQKNWDAAAAIYRNGLKQVSNATELAIKLNTALLAGGKTADSTQFSNAWIKDHPKDLPYRMHVGDIATARKDYDAAARQYRTILEMAPNNAMTLNNLAWVAGQLKDPKAVEYAEKAHKIAPEHPLIMDTLAMLVSDKGDTKRALELLKKAMAKAPDAAAIRLNYARVLIKTDNKAEARKELEELAKLGNKFPAQAEVAQLIKGI